MADLYEDVVGQPRAVAQLRAAAAAPVHAYLFVGAPGTGKRAAALAFAASLLCHDGGCGDCRDCILARAGTHPDLELIERVGQSITVDQARRITERASRSPIEGRRKVLVLPDFHLVRDAAGALLKTIEEPPPTTVFVLLAESVPPELVTIASRCVRVEFPPLAPRVIVDALVAAGVAPDVAEQVATASGGRLDRARLLAADEGFAARQATWRALPDRLDGTGAAVAALADELLASIDTILEPLRARHAAELEAIEERARQYGERGLGRKEIDDRHRRELRRVRTDELQAGLATLAVSLRDQLAQRPERRWLDAIAAVDDAARALRRNPNEPLLLQATLLRITQALSA